MSDTYTVWGGKHFLSLSDTMAGTAATANLVFGDRSNDSDFKGRNRPGANVQLAVNELPVFAALLMRAREEFSLQRAGKFVNANWQMDNTGKPGIHIRFTSGKGETLSVPIGAGDIMHLRIRILSRLRLLYPETPSQMILAAITEGFTA